MILALFVLAAMSTSRAVLAEEGAAAAAPVTSTVWVGGKGQKSMAKKLNETHVEMNAQGWRFVDLEVYTENGDMQGFFVTYVRDQARID